MHNVVDAMNMDGDNENENTNDISTINKRIDNDQNVLNDLLSEFIPLDIVIHCCCCMLFNKNCFFA